MFDKKFLTTEDICNVHKSADKYKAINDIVFAFYFDKISFASPDVWPLYYEVIHKGTTVDYHIRDKAYSNAFNQQLQILRNLTADANSKANVGRQ